MGPFAVTDTGSLPLLSNIRYSRVPPVLRFRRDLGGNAFGRRMIAYVYELVSLWYKVAVDPSVGDVPNIRTFGSNNNSECIVVRHELLTLEVQVTCR